MMKPYKTMTSLRGVCKMKLYYALYSQLRESEPVLSNVMQCDLPLQTFEKLKCCIEFSNFLANRLFVLYLIKCIGLNWWYYGAKTTNHTVYSMSTHANNLHVGVNGNMINLSWFVPVPSWRLPNFLLQKNSTK